VVVRDLTVDCGFDQSAKNVCHEAIALTGSHCRIERVKCINFGVGYNPNASPPVPIECFVLEVATSSHSPVQDSDAILGSIHDCVITQPGSNGTITGWPGGFIPEITCILLAGSGTGPTPLAYGGSVKGNRIYNLNKDDNQTSPIHAITLVRCQQSEVADNEIANVDGAGVYIQSWQEQDLVIRNNRMSNVNTGILMSASTVPSDLHQYTKVHDNVILLGYYKDSSAQAVGIWVSVLPLSPQGLCVSRCFIQRNFVRAPASLGNFPLGVSLVFDGPNYDTIVVEDNVLEIPNCGQPPEFGVPYENALVFFWNYTYMESAVWLHNNRNLAGDDLALKVVDYNWKPYWGPISTRLRRVRHIHDDFLASATAFSLNWFATGLVTSGAGVVDHAGIAVLSVITSSPANPASIKLADNAIVLCGLVTPIYNNTSYTMHVLEAMVKRGDAATTNNRFLCQVGFFDASDNGVYFKIEYAATGHDNCWIGCCKAGGNSALVVSSPVITDGSPPVWHKLRIVVGMCQSGMKAEFYVDDVKLGEFWESAWDSAQKCIPTAGLSLAAKIVETTGSVTHTMSVDYIQYEVFTGRTLP